MTSFCLTLAESDLRVLESRLHQYAGTVPLIEVRLDHLTAPAVPGLPEASETRFIATCRPLREGGLFAGSESDRLALLSQASEGGFSWIDLENDVDSPLRLAERTRLIRSRHVFDRFPVDLAGEMPRLENGRGEVAKLAVSVGSSFELVTLLKWMEQLPQDLERVVIGMGRAGQLTRFLGCALGNSWTYLAEGDEVAPGQFSLAEARGLYRLEKLGPESPLFGVIGKPIVDSRFPLLHNNLFRHYGIEAHFLPIELDDVTTWLDYLAGSRLPFQGFSVTTPFQLDVRSFAEPMESPVDAVNTLQKTETGWLAWNTDFQGFVRPLRNRFGSLAGKRALLIGNGCVARSVAAFLKAEGVKVTVVGRDRGRVERFAQQFGCQGKLFSDLPISAELCVNTTPVGQFPEIDRSPLAKEQLQFEIVYDLICNPGRTALLRWAEQSGSQVISGREMFAEQGAEQFRIWTGIDPNREYIREVLAQESEGGE